ncbi:Protease inhibitor (Tfs1) [Penicillium coprophilum]|uniref:Protease inhibitor (Tfs1) n=1 Tax=Penicillium coprophilum TaxID=36646 RepID=UPI00239A0267|nr:Protease inhibitor (Tfs1) [Penicillium coprophilum]KAJ5165326.1 Protease inhibitor (Tfs1) [Penicillium coprophilum]
MRTCNQELRLPAILRTSPFLDLFSFSLSKSCGGQLDYLLTKAVEAQELPKLSFAGASPTTTYLIVSLDIDAPFPAFAILSPILHWIQSDVKVTSDATLKFDQPFVADYLSPAPPPISAPHRYLFFLYEQPERLNFTAYAPAGGNNISMLNRIRYDLDAWAEEIELGPPVAFNYFTCN